MIASRGIEIIAWRLRHGTKMRKCGIFPCFCIDTIYISKEKLWNITYYQFTNNTFCGMIFLPVYCFICESME